MNGNLNFNVLSNGQPTIQTLGYGLPQVQQNPIQYVCGSAGYQFQNGIPGMEFCVPNPQLVSTAGQTYTCINQNGMTYLAITPSIQQQPTPQCYQAIETSQGLQLFQVINNPVNFSPLCIQNVQQETQGFVPQFSAFPQEPISMESSSSAALNGYICPSPVDKFYQDSRNQQGSETAIKDEPSNEEEDEIEEEGEEVFEEQTGSDENMEPAMTQNIQTNQDPLMALTSLTSSITSSVENNIQNSNVFDVYNKNLHNSFASNIPVPSLSSQLGAQQILGLPDQQFPPNTRAFQVLVPTPQGMAIQTVVASYPDSYSPTMVNNDQVVRNSSFLNLETNLNPEIVTQDVSQQELVNSVTPSEPCKEITATESTTKLQNDTSIISASTPVVLQAKPVTSPCHSTTVSNLQFHPESKSPPSPPALTKTASSTPAPLPSPHCLPDSTEDLCQPTIKQSTSNIVDGIDLEEIREFARTFKMRRLVLGLTQTQVGQALCATEGPAYSQSAICRFEKLDITPRSALKIRPVLENWLREAEEKHQKGNLLQTAGIDYVNISAIGKIRKRRTFFSPEALLVLNNRFEQSSHPSGREISSIAQQIGYERDVVRVWFCNKRQSLRHCQTFQRSRVRLKSSDSDRPGQRSPSPNPP